jgi:Arc/MetJ family transcription regulator
MTKRTNILLHEALVNRGLKATGLKTRRALVHRALQNLVRHEKQSGMLGNLHGLRGLPVPERSRSSVRRVKL